MSALPQSPREMRIRDHEEVERDPLLDRLLPSSPLQPFEQDGSLTEDAFNLVEMASQKAVDVARTSSSGIPAEIIVEAVKTNFAKRFIRTRNSLDAFYKNMGKNDNSLYQRIFEQHEHTNPKDALKFFKINAQLPSHDLAAALCSHDTYSIARDIIPPKEHGRFSGMETVDDDLPHLKIDTIVSSEDNQAYAIITSKKIIARDDSEENQFKMKRRKTYVVPLDRLDEQGLLKAGDDGLSVDTEQLALVLQASPITPDFLHPVIESVYIERTKAIRSKSRALEELGEAFAVRDDPEQYE